jgi:hypothetical protein
LRRSDAPGTSPARARIVRAAQRRLGFSTAIVAAILLSPNADLRLILGASLFGVTASTVPALIRLVQMELANAAVGSAPGSTVAGAALADINRSSIDQPQTRSVPDDDQWPNDQWPNDQWPNDQWPNDRWPGNH